MKTCPECKLEIQEPPPAQLCPGCGFWFETEFNYVPYAAEETKDTGGLEWHC